MTATLTLKPKVEVEARVSQRAAKEGVAVSGYLERIIEEMFQPKKTVMKRSGTKKTRRMTRRKLPGGRPNGKSLSWL